MAKRCMGYPKSRAPNYIMQGGKWVEQKCKSIIELHDNGDPFGSGFVGNQSDDGGRTWYYRGDIGARPRQFWRSYCNKNKCILREAE